MSYSAVALDPISPCLQIFALMFRFLGIGITNYGRSFYACGALIAGLNLVVRWQYPWRPNHANCDTAHPHQSTKVVVLKRKSDFINRKSYPPGDRANVELVSSVV